MEDFELTYSGETKEYTIPENVKIDSWGLQMDSSGTITSVIIISK